MDHGIFSDRGGSRTPVFNYRGPSLFPPSSVGGWALLALDLVALPRFAYSVIQIGRSRCRTWRSERMRLRWALAHRRQSSINLQVPVSIRAFRPYESQSGACPTCTATGGLFELPLVPVLTLLHGFIDSCKVEVTKGRVELPSPQGARRSERRVSASCTTRSCWNVTRAWKQPSPAEPWRGGRDEGGSHLVSNRLPPSALILPHRSAASVASVHR